MFYTTVTLVGQFSVERESLQEFGPPNQVLFRSYRMTVILPIPLQDEFSGFYKFFFGIL